MENYKDTLLSQYANSQTIVSIIETFNDAIDPSVNLDDFYDFVWNVETAQSWGLDIWGKVVDVSRILHVENDKSFLGFDEAMGAEGIDTNPSNFGSGVFYVGSGSSSIVELQDEAYRRLILVKALANITDCTPKNLNNILKMLFPGGTGAFVSDMGNMTMRYTFTSPMLPVDRSIVSSSGVLPSPTGVKIVIQYFDPSNLFGFNEANLQPFGQGVFFN